MVDKERLHSVRFGHQPRPELMPRQLLASPPAGVGSLPRPLGSSLMKLKWVCLKKKNPLRSIRDLQWCSTSTWLGKPLQRQFCVNSPRSGIVDPQTDSLQDGCSAWIQMETVQKEDEMSHCLFMFLILPAQGLRFVSREAANMNLFFFSLFFFYQANLRPNSCSQVLWLFTQVSRAFIPAALQLMLMAQ